MGYGSLSILKASMMLKKNFIKRFSVNASCYTQEQLENTEHCYQLKQCGSTVLCIDYALNGIGSNSCGPVVMDSYRF